ncbi:hypothetical protein QR680_006765 [Steinernema hermaphroditum]|uniref:TIL domain-containing protein n=1 Tax=Steinernema hermaphroditum TaxID=289476 RepID=A0AA39LXM3_9BILA|nr:hypothetical protein QR680_006765 [Steinernema hermaphroditum]
MEAFLASIITDILLMNVTCGTNEQFYRCGACDSVCGVQISCASVCQPFGGCGCIQDHVRDSAGTCIPKTECPPVNRNDTCSEFEIFSKGGKCERTCERPSKRCYRVGVKEACRCLPGYVRDKAEKCVPISSCFKAIFK